MSYVVVYDACVLYPAPLRDFLMHLALTELFQARWSDAIHDEWIRNVLADRPNLRSRLQRTRTLMDKAVPDSLVTIALRSISGTDCRIPGSDSAIRMSVSAVSFSMGNCSEISAGSNRIMRSVISDRNPFKMESVTTNAKQPMATPTTEIVDTTLISRSPDRRERKYLHATVLMKALLFMDNGLHRLFLCRLKRRIHGCKC